MYKKLAVGISICSGATATIIPLVLMWLGYKTPLKLVLWLYLEERGRICMHRKNCMHIQKRITSNIRILTDDTLAELVCLGVHDVAITGDTKLASDTCVVFSSDNLRITPIMKGE